MTLNRKEYELLSIIRNSKDPEKAIQIVFDIIIKRLEAGQEERT